MLATFAALVGRSLRPDEGPDSFNMLPALIATPPQPIRDHLVLCPFSPKHITFRQGRWVYIGAQGNGGFDGPIGSHSVGGPAAFPFTHEVNSDVVAGKLRKEAPPGQLYDLEADPGQTKNLYRERPDVVEQMKARLEEIQRTGRSAPPCPPQDPRPRGPAPGGRERGTHAERGQPRDRRPRARNAGGRNRIAGSDG